MPDSPFGRYSGGLPGRHAGRPAPRPVERSFRCPSTARRRPVEAPAKRYQDFVALHEEISAGSDPALRPLWWTGLACSMLAAGLAFVVVLGVRGLLEVGIPVFAGPHTGTAAAATSYALCAMAGTIQATALMHLLLATAARPVRAFGWIGGAGVLVVAALPLLPQAPPDAALVTAGLNLAGGAAVVALLAAVVAASMGDGPRLTRARRRRYRHGEF
ncbi:hypothetical protein [Actinomadura sp. NEAU-AAG7]|uniref:hypothetical protein n=1 Tax=Actinomadura sp. NEAU-AAG7 TaxID=2839640 RepID=UPI001BE477A4|nr:hypothetical protein [Actinomadura sp. NEAU-AAG7]MBT2211102.1 hypothetical protein [Actinomadura sp. NEAU-AAG7]